MKTTTIEIPADGLSHVMAILDKHGIRHELTGVSEEKEVIVKLDYDEHSEKLVYGVRAAIHLMKYAILMEKCVDI